MKVLTKILNALVVIFVVIGIVSTVYYVREYFKPQIDYYQIVDSLQNELSSKTIQLTTINTELDKIKQERLNSEQKWQKEKENLLRKVAEQANQDKIKELPLDEMLQYILDYYNTDSTEAKIVQDGDSIVIMVTPKLIHSIGLTLAENRDNLDKLEAYKVYIQTSDSLINTLRLENNQLTLKSVTLESINKDLESINAVNKDVIDSKDTDIMKYKFQRNVIAVGGIAVIILLAI